VRYLIAGASGMPGTDAKREDFGLIPARHRGETLTDVCDSQRPFAPREAAR
jgi:hypothetical protein